MSGPSARPEQARILTVFEETLRPGEQHAEAVFGEQIDVLLGFAPGLPAADFAAAGAGIEAAGWRSDAASYGSQTERALQQLCTSCLTFLRAHYALPEALGDDAVCVRVAVAAHAAPFQQSIDGCHYIVLSAGYLKSLENLFRTQERLATLGHVMAARPADGQRIHSNEIGGADAERALNSGQPAVLATVADLFNDVLFWSGQNGPYSYPEAILTALARTTHEMLVGGIYSSEGKADAELRAASTARSQALTRLTAAYVVCHELAHIVLHDDVNDVDAAAQSEMTETLCDTVATQYLPMFVESYGDAWALRMNGGIEHIAGLLGFFMAAEVMEKTGLIIDLQLGSFAQGDARYVQAARRIDTVETRRDRQFKLLRGLLGPQPDMLTLLQRARDEFTVLPIAVEMTGVRLLQGRRSRFADHFDRRLEAQDEADR